MRPLVQPGAIDSQLGNSILARTEQMTNHLPLLVQFAQRQVGVFQPEQIPIVYAQPSSSVEVVQSHTETILKTTTEPLTIVQATLISNSTLNSDTSHLTALNNATSHSTNLRLRQENFSHYTSNSTNLSAGELRREPEGLQQAGSADAIASPSPSRSSDLSSQNPSIVYAQTGSNTFFSPPQSSNLSLQNPPIVYAQTSSNAFQRDRSSQTLMVRPLRLGTLKPSELRDLQGKSLPQVTPTAPNKSDPSTSTSPPIITVRTGTETVSPGATWQPRIHLNETATTIPIVFAQPNPATPSSQLSSRTPPELSQFSEFASSVSAPLTDTFSAPPPPINLDTLTTQIERKLLRRLVVESERRGQTRWR